MALLAESDSSILSGQSGLSREESVVTAVLNLQTDEDMRAVNLNWEPPSMTIMTIGTIRGQRMAKSTQTWAVASAKAHHLGAVIDQALAEGPQTITRRGRKAAVVVSAEEWERKMERKGNLAEFFASSPLRGARVRIKRSNRKARKIEL